MPSLAIVSFLGDTYAESDAGWSSLAARRAHNPKVTGSNPVPATSKIKHWRSIKALYNAHLVNAKRETKYQKVIHFLGSKNKLFNKMNDW